MPKVNISVNPPLSKVGRALKQIAQDWNLQKNIEEFAFEIERAAKPVTPVDTGRLRASIMTDIGNLTATISPHTNYAFFVHEGTRFMKARPFMKIGLERAKMKLYGGEPPMLAHVRSVIDKNLPTK